MLKSSKRLTISTEAVNSFGFRVLTGGIDLMQYRNNPILLWMHQRPVGNSKDQILPLGFISDLELNGTVLSGIPNFDDTDTFAVSIYNKIQNGTIKMCSAGLMPIEQSESPALMLPGQTLPTVVKSILVEVSIADIGSNPDALAVELYDSAGQLIKLNAGNAKSVITNVPKAIGSSGNHNLKTLAVVSNAVEACKLTNEQAKNLLALGNTDQEVEKILKSVKIARIDTVKLAGKYPDYVLHLAGLDWFTLKNKVAGDGTKILRNRAPELYKAKYFEENGKMPALYEGKLV